MVLAEKDFALDLQSGYRFVKILLLSFIVLPLIFSAKASFAVDWTPCEAPCSDQYTEVRTPSPVSGSSHPVGNTVQFTIKVIRSGSYVGFSYLPFSTQVSNSGGTGFSTTTIAPAGNYCIWENGYQSYCTTGYPSYPDSHEVNIVIDVTVGTGTTRVQVKLNNLAFAISPIFYFDVSASGSVRVTGLTDMPSTWNGSGDEENNDNVCVYSSEGTYDLLVEGTVDSGSYVLAEGGTKIPITVYWNNTSGTSGRTLLDSADDPSLTGVTGGDTSSETCSGGNTANISWKALEADMQTKPAGTYSATMTITTLAP